MDIATIIGILLGLLAVGFGMILKGTSLAVLINPAAFLIIIVGTIASVMVAFPMAELKRVPLLFRIIFKNQKTTDTVELIRLFTDLAQLARKEGLLALETRINDLEDPFLRNGLSLAVDGQSADYIRDVLTEEIEAMEERHRSGALIFSQAGTYAPTLGVLGAVIGLIAALGDMSNSEALGHAISAAFVATMLGIFTGYVLWHPFANKLKRKSMVEANTKYLMIEGILSILEGEAPRVIEQKLVSYIPSRHRSKLFEEGSVKKDEKAEEKTRG